MNACLKAVMVTAAVSSAGCGADVPKPDEAAMTAATPNVTATNAFYYYRDVEAAWDFYTHVMGLETVVDYGFAKILRVAPASYLTLVDAERGMHSADEPKSVTLALVTDDPEGWWSYLNKAGVSMRAELGEVDLARPHNGFVAMDPEGYLLEFERFNPHEENGALMTELDAVEALGPADGADTARPGDLTIRATIFWLYYADIGAALAWYEDVLDTSLLVDQGWAKVVQASPTGFLGFVDGSRGLHQATEQKGVTVAFFTDDVEGWFEALRARPDFPLRTPEITDESGRVRTFVGYDPEGYFLEWDTFRDVEGNGRLLELLQGR